jgi:hypothetical protein
MFIWNFNQRWRTGSTITILDSLITQVSFQTALCCWVCQILHETSCQIAILLTCILSAVKTGFQSYCYTGYSRGGVNQKWILKNSKDLLEYIQSRSYNSINTFDFSTLYTSIPHSKLKGGLREMDQLCFMNGQRRYKYIVIGRDRSYFVKNTLWFYQKVLCNWYHQYVRVFDWQHICYVWSTCFSTDSRHTYGHKLCSSSHRLVPWFAWGRLHKGTRKTKRSYPDPLISRSAIWMMSFYSIFLGLGISLISSIPLNLKYRLPQIQINLAITSEGRSRTKLYDKRDDFKFPIVNFPFICSNIPAAPTYGVCISQLIRYSRACGSYQDFLDRGLLLTRKLLNQEFLLVKLKSSLRMICSRYHDLVNVMEYLCHKWPRICSTCRKQLPVLFSFMTYHRVCN